MFSRCWKVNCYIKYPTWGRRINELNDDRTEKLVKFRRILELDFTSTMSVDSTHTHTFCQIFAMKIGQSFIHTELYMLTLTCHSIDKNGIIFRFLTNHQHLSTRFQSAKQLTNTLWLLYWWSIIAFISTVKNDICGLRWYENLFIEPNNAHLTRPNRDRFIH